MVAIEGVRGGKGDLEGRSQLRRRTAGKRYAAFAVAAFDVRDPGEHAFLTTRGGAIDQITQIAGGRHRRHTFQFWRPEWSRLWQRRFLRNPGEQPHGPLRL